MFRLVVPSIGYLLSDIGNLGLVEKELGLELVADLWHYNLNTAWEGLTHNLSYKDFLEGIETPLNDNLKEVDWCPIKREIAHKYWTNHEWYTYILNRAFNRIGYHCRWLTQQCPALANFDPSLMTVECMTENEVILIFFNTLDEYRAYHQAIS